MTPPVRPDVEVSMLKRLFKRLFPPPKPRISFDTSPEQMDAVLKFIFVTMAERPFNAAVHSHGPADGPGLACPERWVGACRVKEA